MADVSFTPTFTHTPWVDNRDRVQAAGPNGFNIRFSQLQSDLQTLSSVVSTIDTELAALASPVASRATSSTCTPTTSPFPPPLLGKLLSSGVPKRRRSSLSICSHAGAPAPKAYDKLPRSGAPG